MTIAPGIHDIPADAYHRDPCPAPSLSASIAHLMLDRSPRHAWTAHPRLNPAWQPDEPSSEQDRGRAIHALLLGEAVEIVTVDRDDWRTKDAQATRKDAWARGAIPLLLRDHHAAHALVSAARTQLASSEVGDVFAQPGAAERTLIWREGNVWCRSRLDWLPDNRHAIYDVKTTSGSANPETWGQRALYDLGAHVQAAFYSRGYEAVTGTAPPPFRFVVIEQEPPYGLAIVQLEPQAFDLARAQMADAIMLWGRCLRENRWPGYPSLIAHVEAPAWQVYRQQGREVRRQMLRDQGRDPFNASMEFHRP